MQENNQSSPNYNTGIVIGIVILSIVIILSNMFINIVYVANPIPKEDNGGIPVNIQDQATRPFAISLNQILDNTSYSISVTPTINSYVVELNTVVGLSTGSKIAFIEQNGMEQIYFGFIKSISGNEITLNDPVPFGFTPAGCAVFTFDNQLNVDGSTIPQVFSLTNFFTESVDITRIIFSCTDDGLMHDGLFCAQDMLTNGVIFRKKTNNGYYINYFNARNNAKWTNIAYDTEYTFSGKPPDDTYGFHARLTYAGQEKHGVVIRLEPNESIELVVQDDLTSISSAALMVEGHFTQN